MVIIIIPASGDVGSYPLTFTLIDVDYLTADYSFILTVALCPEFSIALINQVAPQGQTVIYSLPSITHVNAVSSIQTTDGSGNAIPSYFSMVGDAVSGL